MTILKSTKDIKRILIILPSHIGDAIFSLAAISSIKEKFPNSKIDILINKKSAGIVKGNPNINKIIYTSSSSVYGDNTNSHEYDNLNPKSLHASLKIANEKLIEKFSKDNSINFTITRVFNMYGGNDDFSIVSKIISAYKNNSTLPLINNGEAIRDFIHIEDVVAIYNKLMSLDNAPIVNIGTGIGRSVLFLLTFLKQHDMNIKTSSTSRDELKVSISNNELLLKIYKKNSFINLEENILKTLMEIKWVLNHL